MKLPKARTENLLEHNLEKETLLYDLLIDKAFNLNETLSIVYKACGQNSTFDELKRKQKFTDDFIFLALDELKRSNLLVGDYRSPFINTNRRDVIKKVGLATIFALPIITGLIAPKAAHAASGADGGGRANLGEACSTGNSCMDGLVPITPTDGWTFYTALTCFEGTCCHPQATLPVGYVITSDDLGDTFAFTDEAPTSSPSIEANPDCCGYSSANTVTYTLVETYDFEGERSVGRYHISITKTCR